MLKSVWVDLTGGSSTKESTCKCRSCGFDPWVGKIPWRRKWQLSSIPAWKNPMDRGACSMGLQRVGQDLATEYTCRVFKYIQVPSGGGTSLVGGIWPYWSLLENLPRHLLVALFLISWVTREVEYLFLELFVFPYILVTHWGWRRWL